MPSFALTAAVGLFVAILLNRLYRIVYFLYFSPLRHFPGPKLWAVSRLPLQRCLVHGKPYSKFLELHKQYGPAVRIAPDHLAFSTAQSFKDIYGNPKFTKNPHYHQPPVNGVNHLVVAIDDAEHARHRRLLGSGFTSEALKAQEPIVTEYVDTFVQKLDDKRQSGPVDINLWMNAMSFDLIGDLMFGESFDCLSSNELHPWIKLIFGSMKVFIFFGAVAQWPALEALLKKLIPKSFMQEGIDHFNLSAAKADRRIEMGTNKYDFMSGMMRNGISEVHGPHLKDSKQMSRAEIHSNAYILIAAGSETSATTVSGIVYHLCKHPPVMQKLLHEVRGAFRDEAEINFNSTRELPYMTAVIDESMRVYPAFPHGVQRMSPPGGETVDGHYVPEGTSVSFYHYASYHQPSNFYLPNSFIPERWFGTDLRFVNDKRDVFQPFSYGPRGCIGKNLAYAEIRLVLAKLLFHFDMSLRPECHNWTADQEMFFLWKKGPLMVDLKKRVV